MTNRVALRACILMAAWLSISAANAALIDLTAVGSSATINGAMFETSDPNSGAGSGAIDSFLRTQNDPFEAGFNTDGALNLDQVSGCCTKSITLGQLTVVNVSGTDYFELRLDINEPGGSKSEITLQTLELWVNTTTGSDDDYNDGLGTKVWDLAGDMVQMDSGVGSSGSGDFDYDVLFPVSLLSGFGPSDFLYLYNEFGEVDAMGSPSEAGFEEWAARDRGCDLSFRSRRRSGCSAPRWACWAGCAADSPDTTLTFFKSPAAKPGFFLRADCVRSRVGLIATAVAPRLQ